MTGLSFNFPVPAEFEDDYIIGATLQADLSTDDVAELDIKYNPSTRIARVTIPASLSKSPANSKGAGPAKKASRSAKGAAGWIVVFEWEKSYTPKEDEKILKIPYYKQSGGCCWGMATLMLLKSYKTEGTPPSIADLLKFAESDLEDWGITSWKFMEKVPAFLASHTDLIGQSRSYRLKSIP